MGSILPSVIFRNPVFPTKIFFIPVKKIELKEGFRVVTFFVRVIT